MPTRVADRRESPIQFLATMRDLTALIWSVMGRCPKHTRFIYQTKICNTASDCYLHLIIANSIYAKNDADTKQKRAHLFEALGLLNALEAMLEIVMTMVPLSKEDSNDERYIKMSIWEQIGGMIGDERKLISGLLKKLEC